MRLTLVDGGFVVISARTRLLHFDLQRQFFLQHFTDIEHVSFPEKLGNPLGFLVVLGKKDCFGFLVHRAGAPWHRANEEGSSKVLEGVLKRQMGQGIAARVTNGKDVELA